MDEATATGVALEAKAAVEDTYFSDTKSRASEASARRNRQRENTWEIARTTAERVADQGGDPILPVRKIQNRHPTVDNAAEAPTATQPWPHRQPPRPHLR